MISDAKFPELFSARWKRRSASNRPDVSDSWEREGEDAQYFFRFSVPGYQVAIDVLLCTMTH